MRTVYWKDFYQAAWQIDQEHLATTCRETATRFRDPEAPTTGFVGSTVFTLNTVCTEGQPIRFSFQLEWEAPWLNLSRDCHYEGPLFDFEIQDAVALEPKENALFVGEDDADDAPWLVVFEDDLLFEDVIMEEVWNSVEVEDLFERCG